MRFLGPAALLLALAGPLPAQEEDFLVTEGKLSSEDFYRLVACRALPGGPCTADAVRWDPERARDLRVGIVAVPDGVTGEELARLSRALDAAIAEINATGAALRLRRAAKGEPADVAIHLAPVREGDAISGTGLDGVDGQVIGAALVTVWWDEDLSLTHAAIVLALDLPGAELGPVLLEELAQATGLMTDIRNPAYDGVSVFSEDSNRVTRLGPQDREALRRHYPPQEP